jgi:hypothetical protein
MSTENARSADWDQHHIHPSYCNTTTEVFQYLIPGSYHGILTRLERLPLSSVADHIFVGLADTRFRSDMGVCVPIVNIKHVWGGLLPASKDLDVRTISAGADVRRYEIQDRDVLVTCRGTQLRVGIASAATAGALISANLIAVRVGERLLPEVLLAFLRSTEGQHALHTAGRSSTGLSLKPGDVARLQVPVPAVEHHQPHAQLVQASERHQRAALDAAPRRRAVAQSVVERILRQTSIGG